VQRALPEAERLQTLKVEGRSVTLARRLCIVIPVVLHRALELGPQLGPWLLSLLLLLCYASTASPVLTGHLLQAHGRGAEGSCERACGAHQGGGHCGRPTERGAVTGEQAHTWGSWLQIKQ
jgi:hypothetical protein